jgi:hypothetical protein
MNAGDGAPVLDAAEGDALGLLDALLGRGRPQMTDHTPLEDARPALLEIAADRIARACLELLARGGGWRSRALLRDGERAQGRVFDRELNAGFELRFTEATQRLFVNAARSLPALSSASRRSLVRGGDQRAGKRFARELVPTEGTAPGDWLFYALVDQNIGRFGLSPDAQLAATRRLRRGSPLALLMRLETTETRADATTRLASLLQPRAQRIPECLGERLVKAWRGALTEALRPAVDVDAFTARWTAAAAVLGGWLDALRAARRLDLAGPLLELVAWLVTDGLATDGDLRQHLRRRSGAARIEDGDRALAAIADVTALGAELNAVQDELLEHRYGDTGWTEAQLFGRLWDDHLRAHAGLAAEVTRALRGAIG